MVANQVWKCSQVKITVMLVCAILKMVSLGMILGEVDLITIDSSIVKNWDRLLIDKTTIPRMPWHDMSLCVVSGNNRVQLLVSNRPYARSVNPFWM
jgi:hypothetical protein